MKGKHLFLLLVLVGLVGTAGYYMQKDNRASWSESGGASGGGKVLNFPVNDVARVTVKTSGGQLNLVKKGDEWTVEERADYPAAFEQVSDLIRKLWDLKTVQEVKVGPSQFARMELVEPGKEGAAGTLAEFKDKDGKTLAALLLGKKFMRKGGDMPGESAGFPAGRYVMPVGGASKVSLVSETLDEIDTKAERWLKRDYFKIESPKSIKVDGQTDTMKWSVSRESATAEWKLADAKPEETIDTAKVSSFGSIFAGGTFTDVLAPDAKPEDTGLDKPVTATVETFDKFTYTLKIGKANGENYPVAMTVTGDFAKTREPSKDEKPEDKDKLDKDFAAALKKNEDKLAAEKKYEARAYLIAKSTIDPLLKDRAGLLAEKKPETTSTPPPAPDGTVPVPLPGPPRREPITVTTPPVSAPPFPPPAPGTPPPPAPDAPPKPAAKPDSKPEPKPVDPKPTSDDAAKDKPAEPEKSEKPAEGDKQQAKEN